MDPQNIFEGRALPCKNIPEDFQGSNTFESKTRLGCNGQLKIDPNVNIQLQQCLSRKNIGSLTERTFTGICIYALLISILYLVISQLFDYANTHICIHANTHAQTQPLTRTQVHQQALPLSENFPSIQKGDLTVDCFLYSRVWKVGAVSKPIHETGAAQ